MIGFLQTDPRLNPKTNAGGCACLSSLYLIPDDLSPEEVEAEIAAAVLSGNVGEDRTVLSWAGWLSGIRSEESIERYPLSFLRVTLDQSYQCESGEREILKFWLTNVRENHFTVGDGRGVTAWDSLSRPDIMKAYASFVQKVIVKVG